jgi:hypothetical protein
MNRNEILYRQKIVAAALEKKFGFAPARLNKIVLLEGDDICSYLHFQIKEHYYTYRQGKIIQTNDRGVEKMKYKIGDVVRIRSIEWHNAQRKDDEGDIPPPSGYNAYFNRWMRDCCGKITTIAGIDYDNDTYDLKCGWNWEDWMFDPDFKGD